MEWNEESLSTGVEHRTNVDVTRLDRVATRQTFPMAPSRVWNGLVFYESIPATPPLLLRLLLPVPIGTEGTISTVGDTVMCRYREGSLLKRLTKLTQNRLYQFEVVDQSFSPELKICFAGGSYSLQELPKGGTEVVVETRYESDRRPRWFWKPIEKMVCHSFHRYLLTSIRRSIESTTRQS